MGAASFLPSRLHGDSAASYGLPLSNDLGAVGSVYEELSRWSGDSRATDEGIAKALNMVGDGVKGG